MMSTYYPAAYNQVHLRQYLIKETNTKNPDQTSPREQSDLGPHCSPLDYLRTLADEIADNNSRDLRE